MAAKKTTKRRTEPAAPKRKEVQVTPIEVDARKLVVLDADDRVWSGSTPNPGDVKGAIVKLRPPPGYDPDRVEATRAACLKAGAVRVKVEQRRGDVLPREAVEKMHPARSSAREVVLEMVAEANTQDRAALRDLVEETMGKAGL